MGLIDFDKFWFYNEDNVTKYGGQVEWSIKNYNFDEVSDNKDIPTTFPFPVLLST